MIKSKEDLAYYLSEDRKYYTAPPTFNDWLLKSDFYYIWNFLTELRWFEYRLNTAKTRFDILRLKYHKFKFYRLMHKTKLYLQPNVFAPGVYIPHLGHISVASEAVVGKNCVLRPGTLIASNLGAKNTKTRVVIVGDDVEFSEGCKVICKKIGDNVTCGPNTVIDKNIPDNSIVMGNPCTVVPKMMF
jgi:serine O-acetyltransferase